MTRRNARAAATVAVAFALALAVPATLRGGTIEPPVDAPDDADVTLERADSVSAESVELELGLDGRGNSAARRARAFRFRGSDLDGSVREGGDDPLSGAEVGGRGSAGAWRMSRTAPQWGRGWLMGAPSAPWSDAGAESDARLRSGPRGDAAWGTFGSQARVEGMAGRFAHRDLAAMRAGWSCASLALATTRAGFQAGGLAFESDSLVGEFAMDRARRWRGEVSVRFERPAGRFGWTVRGGSAEFRSLLAPTRSGPPQAMAVAWDRDGAMLRPRAQGALWRFGSGESGARGMLEVDMSLAQHAVLTLGLEEQRGVRRERSAPRGMRQGWWGEWRGGTERVGVETRVECWGRGAGGRDPVRALTRSAFEVRTPLSGRLRVEHAVFRSGSGESLRLAEFDADRVVLRALAGAGERTRVEWNLPGPAGRVRAGWSYTATAKSPARTQWTLRWARRARLKGAPS